MVQNIVDTSTNLDIGSKLATITVFLLVFWYLSQMMTKAIKEGSFRLPPYLLGKFKFLDSINQNLQRADTHKLEVIQTKAMPDGSQLYVLDADGRHLLLSRSMTGQISYLCDLENK